MLVVDLYSLLPAFTLASFLAILLWPENIAYKNRLKLFLLLLGIWNIASLFGMAGYGTTQTPLTCLINLIVGVLGFGAVFAMLVMKPARGREKPR
jgi:hypothetical protein